MRYSRTRRDVVTIVADVMLKLEIRDPQGEAIAGACRRLDFGEVTSVRQGERFEVEVSGAAARRAGPGPPGSPNWLASCWRTRSSRNSSFTGYERAPIPRLPLN